MNEDLTFVAIDFETANADYSSICQVGMVFFENGNIVREISQLINPMTHFDGFNIGKHRITPADVAHQPTFVDYYTELYPILNNQVAVHHQPFDRLAFHQACDKWQVEPPFTYWLDNAAVVRRTWAQFQKKGYALKNVADYLGIEFNHHDACEDARAAGLVFLEACHITGRGVEKWSYEVDHNGISPKQKGPSRQKITGDLLKFSDFCDCSENYFTGKKVVISGTYQMWPDRKELAQIIKSFGADIDSSVSDKTNILCAGNGVGPSKMDKMQKNIEAGKDAVILNETEIDEILKYCSL